MTNTMPTPINRWINTAGRFGITPEQYLGRRIILFNSRLVTYDYEVALDLLGIIQQGIGKGVNYRELTRLYTEMTQISDQAIHSPTRSSSPV